MLNTLYIACECRKGQHMMARSFIGATDQHMRVYHNSCPENKLIFRSAKQSTKLRQKLCLLGIAYKTACRHSTSDFFFPTEYAKVPID